MKKGIGYSLGIVCVVAIFITSGVRGESTLLCLDGATLSDETNVCECQDGLFYNAIEGQCQGICEYYGDNLCGYYANAICEQDESDATAFNCSCPTGYEDQGLDTTSIFCVDENECTLGGSSCSMMNLEECANLPGGSGCKCTNGYYRNDDGDCEEKDLCNQADEYPCEQICSQELAGAYECSCYPGYVYQDGYCAIDDGFEFCFCGENPENAICIEYPNGTQVCEPKPGYQFVQGSDEDVEDLNECQNTFQCPRNSECSNEEGTYSCDCIDNYEYDEDLEECVPRVCDDGLIAYYDLCLDPCDSTYYIQTCPSSTTCLVNSNSVAKCECLLMCQMEGRQTDSTFSVYGLRVILSYESISSLENADGKDLFRYTKSFEAIFGVGNAQVASISRASSGSFLNVYIGVSEPVSSITDLEEVVLSYCLALDISTTVEKCIFPFGVIVDISSITLYEINPCDDSSLCLYRHADCLDSRNSSEIMPGTFQCQCKDGFEEVDTLSRVYCVDINECLDGNMNNCSDYDVCQDFPGYFECSNANSEIASLDNQIFEINSNIDALNGQLDTINESIEDKEKEAKIWGGIFGGLIGVISIVLVACCVYIYRVKFM